MEDELTCPICLDLYRKPVTLPCSHSLCHECFNKISENVDRSVNCPTCRYTIARQQFCELKENKLLSNIVSAYKKEKEKVISVVDMVCFKHPTEQLRLYCKTCKLSVCGDCVFEAHHESWHDVHYIEHLIQVEKESIDRQLKEIELFLQEKKIVIGEKKNHLMKEKENAEQFCKYIVDLLTFRLRNIQEDYSRNWNEISNKLAASERVIETCLKQFELSVTTSNSMKHDSDRYLYYMQLACHKRALLSMKACFGLNDQLHLEKIELPLFDICNVDRLKDCIHGISLFEKMNNKIDCNDDSKAFKTLQHRASAPMKPNSHSMLVTSDSFTTRPTIVLSSLASVVTRSIEASSEVLGSSVNTRQTGTASSVFNEASSAPGTSFFRSDALLLKSSDLSPKTDLNVTPSSCFSSVVSSVVSTLASSETLYQKPCMMTLQSGALNVLSAAAVQKTHCSSSCSNNSLTKMSNFCIPSVLGVSASAPVHHHAQSSVEVSWSSFAPCTFTFPTLASGCTATSSSINTRSNTGESSDFVKTAAASTSLSAFQCFTSASVNYSGAPCVFSFPKPVSASFVSSASVSFVPATPLFSVGIVTTASSAMAASTSKRFMFATPVFTKGVWRGCLDRSSQSRDRHSFRKQRH